jgi:predicted O-methyltransferase YrrM
MMNAVLSEILETGCVRSPDGSSLQLHSHVSPEEGQFLQRIIAESQPKVSLEVGLAYGISALFICEALQQHGGTQHIAIDPAQTSRWNGIGLYHLIEAGYGNLIQFYEQPSFLALPQLVENNTQIDFAFIDGIHTFDYALIDFFYIDRLLNIGGIVAIDDADFPSLQKLCRYIVTNRFYQVLDCLPPKSDREIPWKHKLLRRLADSSATVRLNLKPELLQTDRELGLIPGSRCVAFKKVARDNRNWDFHQEF